MNIKPVSDTRMQVRAKGHAARAERDGHWQLQESVVVRRPNIFWEQNVFPGDVWACMDAKQQKDVDFSALECRSAGRRTRWNDLLRMIAPLTEQ